MNVIDLVQEMGVQPKRVASSKGGEYHSSCPDPACDGRNRFHVWPKEGPDGRYWCRQCSRSGDAIQFCRDFMSMDFFAACEKVGRRLTLPPKSNKMRTKASFVPKQLSMPSSHWSQKAASFVQQSHEYLLNQPHLINADRDRGLTLQSIIESKLGWNPTDIFESRELWGLSKESEGGSHCLCLPQGIVIPSFRENTPIRVKIRRQKWKPEDEYPKYHIVVGGMTCPTLYGDNCKHVIIVEAELDALLVQQVAGDLCCCIALGGVTIRPDTVIDALIRQANGVLFALDFDEAGKNAYRFWKSTFPQIQPWPAPKGKSPGDAHLLGVDLRAWIQSGIRRYF